MAGYPGQGSAYQGGYPSGAGSAAPQGGYPSGVGSAAHQGGYPQSVGGGYPSAPQTGGYGVAATYPGGNPGVFGQPQIDPQVVQWFQSVDTDRSGQITSDELRRALVNGNWSNFSEEACRMMIDMYDKNASGSIDVQEFQQLFQSINQWRGIFQNYDTDHSGSIEEAELCRAFQQMGYRFAPGFVQKVLARYGSRTRRLTLDNFIVVCVQVQRLTAGFKVRDRGMQGQATIQYEDFIGLAMGLNV